jgi:hypothetical protein
MKKITSLTALALLSACAGRAPQPVATAQLHDTAMSCQQIQAEIATNNSKIQDIASERSGKVAQNVAAGVGGFLFPPAWFLMDLQGRPGIETRALQDRNNALGFMATERCKAPAVTAAS